MSPRTAPRHAIADAPVARLAGLGPTTGLALRTNRWFWLIWVLALAALPPVTASAYRTIIPEGDAGAVLAQTLVANPTMRAMLGPPYDLLTAGPFTMWRVGTLR